MMLCDVPMDGIQAALVDEDFSEEEDESVEDGFDDEDEEEVEGEEEDGG